MDPELRSFLEAMERRMTHHTDKQIADAREEAASGRAALEAKIEAAREDASAGLAALEVKIDEARTETRALHEDTWKKIKALREGLSTHQREETKRIVADRERALMDQHILPLRASDANHEKRMKAVETKVGL